MINDKIENRGARFYMEADIVMNDFVYAIKCHISGDAEDIVLHKGIKRQAEAVKQLEYYVEKYHGYKTKDVIADSDIEIDKYIQKYQQITEFTKEKLMKKAMKGEKGLVEICKDWGIQYSKFTKEQCVEEIIKTVEESFS